MASSQSAWDRAIAAQMRFSLAAVNALRPQSPLLVTSGYLVSEQPGVVGYTHVRRLEADSWAADIHRRDSQ